MNNDPDEKLMNSYRVLGAVYALIRFTIEDIAEYTRLSINQIDEVFTDYDLERELKMVNSNVDHKKTEWLHQDLFRKSWVYREINCLFEQIMTTETLQRLVAKGLHNKPSLDNEDFHHAFEMAKIELHDAEQSGLDTPGRKHHEKLAAIYFDSARSLAHAYLVYAPHTPESIDLQNTFNEMENRLKALQNHS